MTLWAISDLHVGHAKNRRFVEEITPHPSDWLILAGDVGESQGDLSFVIETLGPRFERLVWVPGNHELWSMTAGELRGEAKYEALVGICRSRGVLTPEDPYALYGDGDARHLIAPLFLLYDYSFGPDGMSPEKAREWAAESGVECADEYVLHPDPYPTRQDWCAARCALSVRRITEALASHAGPTILVNHFPLLSELAYLPLIPRFRVWCGTRATHDWHRRFRATAVVYGHLHIPGTRVIDGVRFEEVSLGYPKQWSRPMARQRGLRKIL